MSSKEEFLSPELSAQGAESPFSDLTNGPARNDSSERADNSSPELTEQESNPDEPDLALEEPSWDFRELPLSERIDIYLGSFDNKGKLVSSGQINVADDKGSSVDTCTVEVIGDGRALLGGWGGAFYVNYSISDDHADASGGL